MVSAALCLLVVVPIATAGSSGQPVFRGAYAEFPDYLDPQLSYTAQGWTAMYDTYIPLLTYRHADGKAGSEVIPGLAEELPRITDGGRTYTLFLRPGLRYSDGRPVRASDFRFAVERMFKLDSGGSLFYTDIVGARSFARDRRAHISGIAIDDQTGKIVIHLIRSRATFANELALLFVAPVPPGTPMEDQSSDPPPATGPYEITASDPGRGWTYARNPEWGEVDGGLMPQIPGGYVDNIEITVVRSQQTQVKELKRGRLDWLFDPPPLDRTREIEAGRGGTQLRVEPTLSTYYFWLNTSEAPFDDLKVRRAVNYAVDPAVLARLSSGQLAPTDQILPPGIPGYRKFDLYPHDMRKARRLMREADPADRQITVWTDNESPALEAGRYYRRVLTRLGFDARLKIVSSWNYFSRIGNQRTPDLDTGFSNWFEDYPHPNDFFEPLLASRPEPFYNENLSHLVVPKLNQKVARLDRESGPIDESAYAGLDRSFMKLAPIVPYGNLTLATAFSGSVDLDSFVWNPTFEADLTSFRFR
jgi:peptide/nickel transport system substrate-binding protein